MAFKRNENDAMFQQPILIDGAQIGPQLISSTTVFPSFDSAEPREIDSALSIHEYLTTALTGSNNDLTFFAKLSGDQDVTITYTDPGGATSSFAVGVTGSDITVTLARAASAITTTAAQVKAGIEASAEASALVTVELADGNDGTGIVTALTETPLAGPAGTSPTLDVELETSIDDVRFYGINAKFTQKTDAAVTEGGYFERVANRSRWVATVGGTNSVFAFSIATSFKPIK